MTTTITTLTARVIESGPQDDVAVIVVVLLITLLIENQVLDMVGGPLRQERRRAFRAAMAPLLVAFAMIMITRLAASSHPS